MSRGTATLARRLRTTSTSAEDVLWTHLRSRRLDGWKFRRQVPLFGYVVDFYCHDAGLTIEVDGAHHLQQAAQDEARRRVIEAHGLLELRFTNTEVKERLDWVVTEIRRSLDAARGLPLRAAFPRFDP